MSHSKAGRRTALGAILYESKIIKQQDIERALEEQKRSGCLFGEALVKLGVVNAEDVSWGLANQLDLPFIRLTSAQVDPAAVALVPEALARRHTALPFLLLEDELTLVVANPTDNLITAEIGEATGRRINLGIGLEQEILRLLDQVYGTAGAGRSFEVASELWSAAALAELLKDGSGREFLAELLAQAERRSATSVHLIPEVQGTRVSFRINGCIVDVATLSPAWAAVLVLRLRALIDQREEVRFAEGRLRLDSAGTKLRFHVNLLATPQGAAATLINLSPGRFPKELVEIELPRPELRALKELVQRRRGLLVVTGPDTLDKYRLLNLLAGTRLRANEMALAVGRFPLAPPEGFLLVPPSERDERTGAEIVHAVLEQGPDVLLVDGLANPEVLQACLHGALSGRSVYSTLCFPGAQSCLEYLLEVAGSRVLLATALIGIVAVANVGAADPEHDKPVSETAARRILELDALPEGAAVLRRSKSRPASASGRIQIEVLSVGRGLSDSIKAGLSGPQLAVLLAESAHVGLRERVRELVLAGAAPIDEYEVLTVG